MYWKIKVPKGLIKFLGGKTRGRELGLLLEMALDSFEPSNEQLFDDFVTVEVPADLAKKIIEKLVMLKKKYKLPEEKVWLIASKSFMSKRAKGVT